MQTPQEYFSTDELRIQVPNFPHAVLFSQRPWCVCPLELWKLCADGTATWRLNFSGSILAGRKQTRPSLSVSRWNHFFVGRRLSFVCTTLRVLNVVIPPRFWKRTCAAGSIMLLPPWITNFKLRNVTCQRWSRIMHSLVTTGRQLTEWRQINSSDFNNKRNNKINPWYRIFMYSNVDVMWCASEISIHYNYHTKPRVKLPCSLTLPCYVSQSENITARRLAIYIVH